MVSDHPRACGANMVSKSPSVRSTGSSPRVRGKRPCQFNDGTGSRIIPARAGQTNRPWRRAWPAPDHPRACGANSGDCLPVSTDADHPRACGANYFFAHAAPPASGSSPRVRGKRVQAILTTDKFRIIPARAGQTLRIGTDCNAESDHPRACGANVDLHCGYVFIAGSSPRVRGKPVETQHAVIEMRIIPARAGQTTRTRSTSARTTDHPRACGANRDHHFTAGVQTGSSPRVRGKQSDFMRKLLSAGPSIIGFAQWLQSSCYCSCFQSSAKTPISRGTTPTSLFLGFQNSITLLLLT